MKRRGMAPVLACVLGISLASTAQAAQATPIHKASQCASGAVVRENLYAPRSAPSGSTFDAVAVVLNCTGSAQSLTLEGRQVAPGSCFAPAIDPLPVNLAPHQRFTLKDQIMAPQCTGTYTVTWAVVQGNRVVASRTRHITIT